MEALIAKGVAGLLTLAFVAFIAFNYGRKYERSSTQQEHIEIVKQSKQTEDDVANTDSDALVDELFADVPEGLHGDGTTQANPEPKDTS